MARKSAIDMIVRENTNPCRRKNIRTVENRLLCEYYWDLVNRGVRGTIYAEVPVNPSYKNDIMFGSILTKRVDAIFIPGFEKIEIIRFKRSSNSLYEIIEREFFAEIEGQDITLIEVKKKLNFTAIGQVLAYAVLVKKSYHPNEIQKLIICHEKDQDLLSTLEKYGIELLEL